MRNSPPNSFIYSIIVFQAETGRKPGGKMGGICKLGGMIYRRNLKSGRKYLQAEFGQGEIQKESRREKSRFPFSDNFWPKKSHKISKKLITFIHFNHFSIEKPIDF